MRVPRKALNGVTVGDCSESSPGMPRIFSRRRRASCPPRRTGAERTPWKPGSEAGDRHQAEARNSQESLHDVPQERNEVDQGEEHESDEDAGEERELLP